MYSKVRGDFESIAAVVENKRSQWPCRLQQPDITFTFLETVVRIVDCFVALVARTDMIPGYSYNESEPSGTNSSPGIRLVVSVSFDRCYRTAIRGKL